MSNYKYICTNNPSHLYEEPTGDYWCSLCDIADRPMLIPYTGESIDHEVTETKKQDNSVEINSDRELVKADEPEVIATLTNRIREVTFGDQIWMEDFLATRNFNNGSEIYYAKNEKDWLEARRLRMPALCYPTEIGYSDEQIGLLYNYYAVSHPSGLAPQGWEVPGLDQVNKLMKFDLMTFLSHNLQQTFTEVVNCRLSMGTLIPVNNNRIFWTRTNKIQYTAHAFIVNSKKGSCTINLYEKSAGFFVRCIKSVQ